MFPSILSIFSYIFLLKVSKLSDNWFVKLSEVVPLYFIFSLISFSRFLLELCIKLSIFDYNTLISLFSLSFYTGVLKSHTYAGRGVLKILSNL